MKMRGLVILTSHAAMGDTGNPTGFWLEELAVPYYAFLEAGAELVVASPAGGPAPLDPLSLKDEYQSDATRRFRADRVAMAAVADTVTLDRVEAADFDFLFYPGGHGPMWDLAVDRRNAELVRDFVEVGKPVAAICHGPAALVAATRRDGRPVVAGETVTCFTNREEVMIGLEKVVPFLLEDRLGELGARFVCADPFAACTAGEGLVLTGQNPASSGPLARRVLERVRARESGQSA
ncbi:MAG: type 1 glutamine amidotransferase domain-containing protein [Planctomycetota bacterium]